MNSNTAKSKIIKRILVGVLVIIVLCIILIALFRPLLVYFNHRDELNGITDKITSEYPIRAYSDETDRYYIGLEQTYADDIDEALLEDIQKLFEDESITYIGFGCPINNFYCWSELYVRFYENGRKEKYLMYCEDDNTVPDYSDYGPIRCSWVWGDWYCITIGDIRQVKTP